jgi:hypothetical protein
MWALFGVTIGGSWDCRPAARPPEPPPQAQWTSEDRRIFESTVRWALDRRLDTLPQGPAMARIAERFIGADYIPSTLEVPGPERLVINLRAFDCVTFVENVIALAWFVRRDGLAALADPALARRRYEGYLTTLRYRDGVIAGYPSRLHYFSEWLGDNARRGHLAVVSDGFGSRLDDEPIGFMSAHPASYRQMAEPGVAEAIRAVESRLNATGGRRMVREQEIAAVAGQIRDGDVIAATSTLPGLDIAHTGIAVWRDGRLHLLHAPLVGKSVELSEQPLADRIVALKAQDGIMVGRVREQEPGTREQGPGTEPH